jgi:hypothetical protein
MGKAVKSEQPHFSAQLIFLPFFRWASLPRHSRCGEGGSHRVAVSRSDKNILTFGHIMCKLFKMNELQIKQPSGRTYPLKGGQTDGISRFKVASQARN